MAEKKKVVVDGYEFRDADSTESTEWLAHTDARGWHWYVFCHKVGPWAGFWLAMVSDGDRQQMLNTATYGFGGVGPVRQDPLYKKNDRRTARQLIRAMIPLIKAGEWPQEIVKEVAA